MYHGFCIEKIASVVQCIIFSVFRLLSFYLASSNVECAFPMSGAISKTFALETYLGGRCRLKLPYDVNRYNIIGVAK